MEKRTEKKTFSFKKICLVLLVLLLSAIITQYFININYQEYRIQLSEYHPNYENIQIDEYWYDIILNNEYHTNYDIPLNIFDTMKINDGYLYISGKNIVYDDANRLLRALLNYELSSNNEFYIPLRTYSTELITPINPMFIIFVVILEMVILILYMILTKTKLQVFKLEYWKSSRNEMRNIKKLCTISLIFSLQVVAGMLPIPSGFGNLGVGLSYLFQATNCLLFGPFVGLVVGFVGDIIGYMISPSAFGFFFPYTINAMLSCLMYGLCFYKTKVTFSKVLISRIFINLFINAFLGSIWWGIVVGLTKDQTINYALFISLPKNLLYLIPQSIVLYIVIKSSVKLFYKNNFIEEYQTNVTLM